MNFIHWHSNCKSCLLNLKPFYLCHVELEWIPSSTGEKHLFSISVSVFYVLCTFVLLDILVKCFSRYCAFIMFMEYIMHSSSEWTSPYTEDILCECLYWFGWEKMLLLQLFLDVGIWNLDEWKCICVTSSERVYL